MDLFIMQAVSGISVGFSLFMVASGLVIIFSILQILNIAHGAFYMLGSYLCFWVVQVVLSGVPPYVSFPIALLASATLAALFGGLIEISIIHPIYKSEPLYQMILTFGLAYVIADICRLFWGMNFFTVAMPAFLAGPLVLGNLYLPKYNVFLIGVGLFVYIALLLIFQKTKVGMVLRATTTDREMMNALGWNVKWISTFAFMLGIFLASLGGALAAPMNSVGPGIDAAVLVNCFIVVVVAGFGSIGGALVSAVLLGLVNSFGIIFIPRVATALPFVFMVIILVVRPWGLFGKPIRTW